jgi:ABC-type transport system involved in multi-copper enzyme maturation permease subunit
LRALRENPVLRKELRGRMRGRRAFVVLSVYLVLLSCLTTVLYFSYTTIAQQPYGPDTYLVGKIVFGGMVGVQLLMVVFLTPAFTAGAITGERERQTYDLLRTTLLSARSLVTGKLSSALTYMVLLILAAVPLESLAFLLGGVELEEVIISQLFLLVTALSLAAVSMAISSWSKSTLTATVLSYGYALLSTAGLPLLFLMLTPFLGLAGFTLGGAQEPAAWLVVSLVYLGGLVLATNPFSSLILSEVVLIQEQTLLFFELPLSQTSARYPDLWLISPWVIYLLFYLLVAWVAFAMCVRRVRRVER